MARWCDGLRSERGPDESTGKSKRERERERGQTVATSRKQSGRRPLKILLRIVCHFTSERSRSGWNGLRSHPCAASQREQTSVFTDSFGITCNAHIRRDSVYKARCCCQCCLPMLSPVGSRSFRSTRRPLSHRSFPRTRRANSTLLARLVRHWDCQGRTARISEPTFRCRTLSEERTREWALEGPQMGSRYRLSGNGILRSVVSPYDKRMLQTWLREWGSYSHRVITGLHSRKRIPKIGSFIYPEIADILFIAEDRQKIFAFINCPAWSIDVRNKRIPMDLSKAETNNRILAIFNMDCK